MSFLSRLWLLFLAYFRLSGRAVCEMSRGLDFHGDYHNYKDDEFGEPVHLVVLKCKRCGKNFMI